MKSGMMEYKSCRWTGNVPDVCLCDGIGMMRYSLEI